MRIVIYGNFAVDFSSESHHAKTLISMGHDVVMMQETTATTEEVLKESVASDLLVWIHTHGFKNQGTLTMGDVLRILKKANIPTMAYHLDLYMGIQRWKDYENSEYFQIGHFFATDKLMADWFNENTEVKGHFIPAGVYDKEAYLHEDYDGVTFDQDIIFVGSKGYHPEYPYRPQLIEWLRNTYGSRFLHVGGDGDTGTIRGDALNRIYAKSKIAIGDSLNIGFNYPYYTSDRLFESTGRGGFTIYPDIYGLDTYFKDKKEVVFYQHGNLDALKTLTDYYLEHDDKREDIRIAGIKRTAKDHTYFSRWSTILKELGL
jgi:Glycosyl transferases group 1